MVYLPHKIRISYFNFNFGSVFAGYVCTPQTSATNHVQSFIQDSFKQLLLPCPAHKIDGACDGFFCCIA